MQLFKMAMEFSSVLCKVFDAKVHVSFVAVSEEI